MVITWHGFSSFKLEAQNVSVILNPFDGSGGLRQPRYSGDVVLSSFDSPLYNNVESVKDAQGKAPFIIYGPGEYEIKGVYVYGVKPVLLGKQNITLYKIDIEDVSIACLGNLNEELSDADLDVLEGSDILLVPVGGGNMTLDAEKATKIITQIEPRIVIPMHYTVPGAKPKMDAVELFKKEIGVSEQEVLTKFKVTKKDLPQEAMMVVILQP